MDMDNITSVQAYYEKRQKEEQKEQQAQQERNFDKSVSLATLDQLQKQNELLRTQNLQLQKDSAEGKIANKRVLIASIITICISLATLIVTIVLHFIK